MIRKVPERAVIPTACKNPSHIDRRNHSFCVRSKVMPTRTCAYCGGPIPSHVRADARYCGPSHRAMASQKRLRSARRKQPARVKRVSVSDRDTIAESKARSTLVPLHVRLLPASFLEAEPWLWLEILLRTSAPPRAATFTVAPFAQEACAPLPIERYSIQPFVPPKLQAPGWVEVSFYSDSNEPLTTGSRLLIELGNR